MEKHIQLVGILNIAYRALIVIAALVLVIIAAGFSHFMEMLVKMGSVDMRDVPYEVLEIVPFVLVCVAFLMFLISVVGIIAAIGVLGKKKWGRVLMLVISFFHLFSIPVGTALGGYSIWVLLNDEAIKAFESHS